MHHQKKEFIIQRWTNTRIPICLHTYIHISMHTYLHTYIHTKSYKPYSPTIQTLPCPPTYLQPNKPYSTTLQILPTLHTQTTHATHSQSHCSWLAQSFHAPRVSATNFGAGSHLPIFQFWCGKAICEQYCLGNHGTSVCRGWRYESHQDSRSRNVVINFRLSYERKK